MKYKTAIIGPKDIISGFKALGVVPFDVKDGGEALEIIKSIKSKVIDGNGKEDKFAVIILIESIANRISEDEFAKVYGGALPAIVVLPGIEGSTGAGIKKLRSLAERAVGSDILG